MHQLFGVMPIGISCRAVQDEPGGEEVKAEVESEDEDDVCVWGMGRSGRGGG